MEWPAAHRISGRSILARLHLDECLYRDAEKRSWLVVPAKRGLREPPPPRSQRSPTVVVLGLSGNLEELVDVQKAKLEGVDVVRRFSGGGTVAVDADSLLLTLVTSQGVCAPYPREIMQFAGGAFARALSSPSASVSVRENDLAVRDVKIAGNAQAISGSRWMHHTSVLWDVSPLQMSYLKMPVRRPAYRQDRGHLDFVSGLRHLTDRSQSECIDSLVDCVAQALGVDAVVRHTPVPSPSTPLRSVAVAF